MTIIHSCFWIKVLHSRWIETIHKSLVSLECSQSYAVRQEFKIVICRVVNIFHNHFSSSIHPRCSYNTYKGLRLIPMMRSALLTTEAKSIIYKSSPKLKKPPIISGGGKVSAFFRKSIIISLVLGTFKKRLFSSHHLTIVFTWFRYLVSSLLMMNPETVVSSANLMIKESLSLVVLQS